MFSTAGNQEVCLSLCTCAVNQWSMGQGQKIHYGQTVKAIFGWSKILTAVTAPMGVTPLKLED